jgi:hypothetical protein
MSRSPEDPSPEVRLFYRRGIKDSREMLAKDNRKTFNCEPRHARRGSTSVRADTLEGPVHGVLETAVADAQQQLARGLALSNRRQAKRTIKAGLGRKEPTVTLVLE